jgi:hypothetical protein
MAKEAGGYLAELPNGNAWVFDDEAMLERFADLAAAHSFNDGWIKGNKGLMEAVREEREACANVCEAEQFEVLEDESCEPYNVGCRHCAAAIRTRSMK